MELRVSLVNDLAAIHAKIWSEHERTYSTVSVELDEPVMDNMEQVLDIPMSAACLGMQTVMSKTSTDIPKKAFFQFVSAMFFPLHNLIIKFAQTRTRFLFNSMAGRDSPAVVSPSVTHLLY